MQSSYITSAQRAHQLPELGAPEIAMVGRSNCGKSSLLNALTQRRNLARASSTPGRTQMVNFFAIDKADGRLILADLPGYGFSASGRESRRHWQELVTAYLKRPALKQILFLVDIRRADPPGDEDMELLRFLVGGHATVLPVLTKADKMSAAAAKVQSRKFLAHLEKSGFTAAEVAVTSTLKQTGIADLQRYLGITA